MSYSRWGESRWFVFGSSSADVPKDLQGLSIHDSYGMNYLYTFSKLKGDLQSVLAEIQNQSKASEEEIFELKGYILSFLRETEFPWRCHRMRSFDYFFEKHEYLPVTDVRAYFLGNDKNEIQLDLPEWVPEIEVIMWAKHQHALFFIGEIKDEIYKKDYGILGTAFELTETYFHSTIVHWVYKGAVQALIDPEGVNE